MQKVCHFRYGRVGAWYNPPGGPPSGILWEDPPWVSSGRITLGNAGGEGFGRVGLVGSGVGSGRPPCPRASSRASLARGPRARRVGPRAVGSGGPRLLGRPRVTPSTHPTEPPAPHAHTLSTPSFLDHNRIFGGRGRESCGGVGKERCPPRPTRVWMWKPSGTATYVGEVEGLIFPPTPSLDITGPESHTSTTGTSQNPTTSEGLLGSVLPLTPQRPPITTGAQISPLGATVGFAPLVVMWGAVWGGGEALLTH